VLDEWELRKPKFDEGHVAMVELADGQAWGCLLPMLELRPVFQRGVCVRNYPVFTYGRDLDGLIAAVGQAEDFLEVASLVATLAGRLLQQAYKLTDSDLDQLLAFDPAVPTSTTWVARIVEIAAGRDGVRRRGEGEQ
jgi:hypothetical protein